MSAQLEDLNVEDLKRQLQALEPSKQKELDALHRRHQVDCDAPA